MTTPDAPRSKSHDRDREAHCTCGQLRLVASGDPIRISICHCLDCQRRTGSVFAAQARFPEERIRVSGEATMFSRTADSGQKISFWFCPTCGTTVFYRLEADPETVAVALGTFGDPKFPAPWFSVYESRKHDWVVVPEDIVVDDSPVHRPESE